MHRAFAVAAAVLVAAVGAVPRAGADPTTDLARMLPAGYSTDSCKPASSTRGALAAVDCRDNSLPGGPTSATYYLFRDYTGMYDAFTAGLKSSTWAPATCPGKQSSDPTAMSGPDGKQHGFIACGRWTGPDWQVKDGAVAWTRNAEHFLGVAYVGYQGQQYPASLFNWVRAPQIESDCASSGGKYTAWHGDAEIYYSECCFKDHCDEYVDGDYQGRSPG